MFVGAVLLANIFCSCRVDEIPGLEVRYVSGVVSTENGIETKAASAAQHLQTVEINEDGLDLFVTASRSVNTDNPFTGGAATKGAIITEAQIGFKMAMVTSAGKLYKEGTAEYSGTGDYWSMFSGGAKVEWPSDADAGVPYDFYAFLGNVQEFTYGETSQLSYTGNTPEPADAMGKTGDAQAMQDVLVAYTADFVHDHATYATKAGLVPLHFYHALAAVRFNVTPDVRRVTINGVAKDGVANVLSVDPTEEDDFTKAFSWTAGKTKVSYSQSNTGKAEDLTFFIVPQTLSEVTVTFEVEKDGITHQITTPAGRLGTSSWTAGYIYKYTIDSATEGNVGIRVVEEFLANVSTKNHIGARSSARSTVYARAYVVGNWCLEGSHVVYAPWSDKDVKYEITGEGAPWFKYGDYYYCKDPIVAYTSSEDLIKQYIENKASRPRGDLHLELHVLTQAVEWDAAKANVTAAWGSEVASRLN